MFNKFATKLVQFRLLPIQYLSYILFFYLPSYLQAQEQWDLRKCIDFAVKNNINLSLSQNQLAQNGVNLKAAKAQQYPSLNGSFGLGYNLGRTIDPTSNSFATQSLGTNNISLNSNIVLFQGGAIRNSIKQAANLIEAAKMDYQQSFNDVALSVAQAYLQVLFAEESLNNANRSKGGFVKQLEQVDKLISNGARPKNDRLEVLSQMATSDQNIISFTNTLESSYLNLKVAMGMDPEKAISIIRPEISVPSNEVIDAFKLNSVYGTAEANQPVIKAGMFREISANNGVSIAKGARWPTIVFGASTQTNYASLGKEVDQINIVKGAPTPIILNGSPAIVEFYQSQFTLKNTPYLSQLDQNIGLGLFLSCSIPIIDNGKLRSNVQRAQLQLESVKIQNSINKQNLRSAIQKAINDVKLAKKQFDASVFAETAAKALYEDAEKRFNIGNINSFDLSNAKIRFDNAIITKLIAKYDLVFKIKVVEFYQGKQIDL